VTTFEDLTEQNLADPALIRALAKNMGFSSMTDVQRLTLPLGLQGKDM
jgi:superfamily II DNA/RNA helicase